MSSSSKRFTRLEKICVFLIVMGKDRAREILADMDIDLIQKINATMISLGNVTALEKATIMIEFGDFFHKDAPPLSSKLGKTDSKTFQKNKFSNSSPKNESLDDFTVEEVENNLIDEHLVSDDEEVVVKALELFKSYASKINWKKAGYDFGEGFQGLGEKDREV